jgi:hypothetical protein
MMPPNIWCSYSLLCCRHLCVYNRSQRGLCSQKIAAWSQFNGSSITACLFVVWQWSVFLWLGSMFTVPTPSNGWHTYFRGNMFTGRYLATVFPLGFVIPTSSYYVTICYPYSQPHSLAAISCHMAVEHIHMCMCAYTHVHRHMSRHASAHVSTDMHAHTNKHTHRVIQA